MGRANRVSSCLLAGALLTSLGACGGGSPSGGDPPPPPPPPPPAPAVIAQGNAVALPKLIAGFVNFTTSSMGTVEAIVDWTFPSNDVDVYITRGVCTFEQFVAEQCTILAFSESTTAKPERPRAVNVPAGTHTVWALNVGPGDETVSYQVVFTANAAAGGAGPSSASSSRSTTAERSADKGALRGARPLR